MRNVYKITAATISSKSVRLTFRNLDTAEVVNLALPVADNQIAMARLKRIYEGARVLWGEDLDQLVGQTIVAKNPDWPMVGPAAEAVRAFSFARWLASRKAHDNERGDVIRKARRFGLSTFGAINAVSVSARAKKAARRLWGEYIADREALAA